MHKENNFNEAFKGVKEWINEKRSPKKIIDESKKARLLELRKKRENMVTEKCSNKKVIEEDIETVSIDQLENRLERFFNKKESGMGREDNLREAYKAGYKLKMKEALLEADDWSFDSGFLNGEAFASLGITEDELDKKLEDGGFNTSDMRQYVRGIWAGYYDAIEDKRASLKENLHEDLYDSYGIIGTSTASDSMYNYLFEYYKDEYEKDPEGTTEKIEILWDTNIAPHLSAIDEFFYKYDPDEPKVKL